MSDDISISYSFNLEPPGPAGSPPQKERSEAAAPPELVALHDCDTRELSSELLLLVSKLNGRSFPVSKRLAAALQFCREYRSVGEHVELIQSRLAEKENPAVLAQLLQALGQAGLLSTSSEVCARINPAAGAAAPQLAPTRLFIITCDRPDAVQRLLDSILHNADLALHDSLYLIDDSRNPAQAERNRKLLATSAGRSPIPMIYFGAAEQGRFIDSLAERLPEFEDEIRFLVDRRQWSHHPTYGLSRSWALLLSVGYRCLMLDDDVLCEAYGPSAEIPPVTLGEKETGIELFASEAAWRAVAAPVPRDPLAGHSQCLGMSLAQVLGELGDGALHPDQLQGASLDAQAGLEADSPVLITQCGTLGDPGGKISQLLLTSRPDTTRLILSHDNAMELAFTQRQFWMACLRPTLERTAAISQMTGVDNTRLMPPYFPAFRGEDMVFGWMVNRLYPGSRTLNYPWAVPHLPLESRGTTHLTEKLLGPAGLSLAVDYFSHRVHLWGGSSAEAFFGLIAALLRELADKPRAEQASLLRQETSRYPAYIFACINEKKADLQGVDPRFDELLEQTSNQVSQRLQAPPGLAASVELPPELSDEEALDRLARAARTFASALEAWPQIWRAAGELGAPPPDQA